MTGGGPTWITGSYDPNLDLLYWTVGNPGPDFNAEVRPGDNLYTNSVLTIEPDTGKLRWYYQWTPHDRWDYDGVNEVILADLNIDGRSVKALIHADKNAHFYVLDRTQVYQGQAFRASDLGQAARSANRTPRHRSGRSAHVSDGATLSGSGGC